jgi:tetratricopeptide (TPR) repeat protein
MEYRLFLPALPLIGMMVFLLFRRLPRWAPAICAVAILALAIRTHLRARDYETGMKLYTQQLSVDPKSLFAWDAIAGWHFAEGSYESAADAAAKMIGLGVEQRAPDFLGRAYHYLGMIEFTAGRHERAIDYFREGIAVANTVSSKSVLAALLLKKGEDAEAARLLDQVLAYVPDRADALFLRFEMKLRAGRLDEAEEVLDRLAEYHPGHPGLLEQQARLARHRSGAATR